MENSTSSKGNILYIVLAVIIVAAIGYVVYSNPTITTPGGGSGTTVTPGTGGTTGGAAAPSASDLSKAQILSMTSSGKTLTADEKRSIFQSLVGDKIKAYNFTEKERQQVISALNK